MTQAGVTLASACLFLTFKFSAMELGELTKEQQFYTAKVELEMATQKMNELLIQLSECKDIPKSLQPLIDKIIQQRVIEGEKDQQFANATNVFFIKEKVQN